MKASQKIALEMSIKREKLNALLGEDELDDAQRGEMGALTVRRLGHGSRYPFAAERPPLKTPSEAP